jgi:predicted Rossmann fold flavoprotein
LSGPAVLKLSAWGARELAALNYEFPLVVNWAPPHTRDALLRELGEVRARNPRKQIDDLESARDAAAIVGAAGQVSRGSPPPRRGRRSETRRSARWPTQLTAADLAVVGKSLFKDEFVTCGGVRLSEVDFKTMESRVCPGLHFAGELLDIDGVTGGFNFQAAWTTGWLAGQAMAE